MSISKDFKRRTNGINGKRGGLLNSRLISKKRILFCVLSAESSDITINR